MSKLIKILVFLLVTMALASCTPAQVDCAFGSAAGCAAASLGY